MIKALMGAAAKLHPPPQVYPRHDTPTCAICGCTEEAPCFDGELACFWVTLDRKSNNGLCSECLGF